MKSTRLLAALLPLALMVGCATETKTGSAAQGAAVAPAGDAAITQKVQAALAADAEVGKLPVKVSTADGRVTLKGEIKSLALRKKVESIVRGVQGVKSVDNQLVITG